MNNKYENFEQILNKEEELLDSLTEKQAEFKVAVMEKNWEKLTSVINKINVQTDDFVELDAQREEMQNEMRAKELKPYSEKLGTLRAKLLKWKIENQALEKYVSITKDFIKEVVDNALPQSGNKVYSKRGMIVQPQPQSIVVNQLF
ncbi:MAG: hypothetical protein J5527_02250 [Treponema sp.]|nr:hypothetical protein [Treponema sp.]